MDTLGKLMWEHAQSAFQAELDSETMEEAFEVAAAEMSTLTLLGRLRDSLGRWITCSNGADTISGQLVEICKEGTWIHVGGERSIYLRVDTLRRLSGLASVASSDNPQSSRARTIGSWLRELTGSVITINPAGGSKALELVGFGVTGQLVNVGMDFIEMVEIDHHQNPLPRHEMVVVVPLAAIFQVEAAAEKCAY